MLIALLFLSALASAATYTNPVMDLDFPDPTVVFVPQDAPGGGWYYAYATQAVEGDARGGRIINIQVARSRDLVRWEMLPDALPTKPWWASSTQKFWAPHVSYHDGTFYLYFSAEPNERNGMCFGAATSNSSLGPFVDSGKPMRCDHGFASIDPFAFDDPKTGKRLLYWGSGFEPIRVQELAADRVSFKAGSRAIELVPADASSEYERLVEGAWITVRDGWYYLYYSGGDCCGDPRYAVSVARSRSATGPFEKMGLVLESAARGTNPRWFAPGHNSVIRDAGGRDWMLYHAIDRRAPYLRQIIEGDRNVRRVLLIDPIRYENGRPVMDGASPSFEERPAPSIDRR